MKKTNYWKAVACSLSALVFVVFVMVFFKSGVGNPLSSYGLPGVVISLIGAFWACRCAYLYLLHACLWCRRDFQRGEAVYAYRNALKQITARCCADCYEKLPSRDRKNFTKEDWPATPVPY